jgi:hypothetical protein
MTKKILWVVPIVKLLGSSLYAQDIVGDWQGTLEVGKGFRIRIVLQIAKSDSGDWTGKFYSIDSGPDPTPVSSLTLQGSNLKFAIEGAGANYEGTLSADRRSIHGTWTQGEGSRQPDTGNLAASVLEEALEARKRAAIEAASMPENVAIVAR